MWHTLMFQNIKEIWILGKDNPHKYKIQFLHDELIYFEKNTI